MAGVFLKIVNMSISAAWLVVAVLIVRLLLKKAPKWINTVLWGIVGLRLVMPFSFESVFSLIPSAETISKAPDSPRPHFESGLAIVDDQVNEYLYGHYFEGITRPTGHFVDVTTILAIVWIVGIAVLIVYTLVSYLKLKNKIGTAVLLRDNIYQSESVISPFVLGVINPKIYLPFNMSEQDMQHVIAHEQAHIRCKDHIWKPLGFLILTLHWFNPLVWLGYVLLCRDIELACDEKVVKDLSIEQKADYSQALLTCSVNRRMIAACPIAFGEVGVKDRVKSVLNYKKPAFWIVAVAVVASIAVAVCFLTNPITLKEPHSIYEQFLEGKITALDENKNAKLLKDYFLVKYNAEEEYTYSYFDMTGDGSPELCVNNIPEMYFFTVKNGELYHWYTETNGYSKLLNNGAFLMERHGAAPTHINYEYYELDKNASKKFSIAFSWWDKTTVGNEDYPEFYEINGKEVSKAEYEEKMKKYLTIGTDKIVWYGRKP